MKKVISITLKVILWLLAGIIVLAVAIVLLVQVPAVQDFGRKKLVNYLGKKLETKVAIGHIRLGLPNTLLIEDVYLEDRQQDTLLAAGKLFVDISLLRLLDNEVKVNQVTVEKFYSRIHHRADSSFNFDFIAEAFDTGETAPEPEDSSAASMVISLGEFTLDDVRLNYIDETMPAEAAVSVGHFYTRINHSDIENMRFGAVGTESKDLYLSYNDGGAGMETLTRLGRLDLSSLNFDLEQQQVNLGEVQLDSSLAVIAFTAAAGDPDAAAGDTSLAQAALPAGTRPAEVTADTAALADPGWRASVKQLLVKNTAFQFDDHNAAPQPEGIDYMHMQLSGFNADLRDFSYAPDQIDGSLRSASFHEKSGFLLKTLRTDFLYTDTGAALDKLYMETGGSVLQERIRVSYPSLELIAEDPAEMAIDAKLSSCRLSYTDMLLLAPFLAEYEPFKSTPDGIIGIDGLARGRVDDLHIEDLEVNTLERTYLAASAHMKGLPDMDKAWFDVQLKELTSGRGDLLALAGPEMIPASIRLPDRLSLEGTFRGSMDQFGSSAMLRSSYGNIAMEGTMAAGGGEGRERYTANVRMDNFDVGRLLRQEDTLGRVSMNASLKGSGTTLETADAQLEGQLRTAVFNGYTYSDMTLSGTIRDQQVNAVAAMNDPNLDFDLNAAASLSGNYPSVKMDLQLDTLDLQALNLYEKKLQLGLEIDADLPVADPDSLNGTVLINDLSLTLDSGAYRLDTIAFRASATDTLQAMSLHSDFIQASLSGKFTTAGLAPAMMAHIDRYFQTGISDSLRAAAMETAPSEKAPAAATRTAATRTAAGRDGAQAKADTVTAADSIQHINLTARISHPPILRELLPELSRLDTVCIDALFDNRKDVLQVNAVAPAIRYGSNEIDSVLLAVNTGDTSIDYHLGVKRIYNPAVQVVNTSLAGQLAGNRASIELLTRDQEMKPHYRIAGTLAALDKAYQFRFDPGQLLLDYEEWSAEEDNLFHYSDSGFYAKQIRLTNGEQLLLINSEEYRPGAPLGINLKDFQISTLTRIAQQDSLAVDGRINGDALISNLDSSMIVVSDLLVNDFSFRQDTVGDITLKMSNEQENTYAADVSIKSDKNQVNLAGYYYPQPVEGNSFDLALDIIGLDMETVEAFSFGQLRDASGQLKGSFSINGTADAPHVTGGLVFQKIGFTPTYINSPFFLEDETIALTEEGIAFEQFTLLDSLKNKAVLDGMIYTTDFTDYRFDLDLTTRNFQAVNTAEGDNELFYGQLYLDSDVNIEGTMDNPAVDAYLRVNEKTNLTMVLPADEPGVQEREGVVEFVDMDAPADTLQTDTLQASTGISGLELSADLEIDEEAQFTVVVDPVNGDNLRIKGNGALSTSMDPNGVITLTGRYEIAEGAYELSFNMLKRRFQISQGSYITWVGDPYSADVDITAVYIAETQPLELVQDQLTNMSQTERNTFKQKLPFQVELQMEGELMKPQISFNIDLPEKERDAHGGLVYSRLQQLQLQESDLNKQVFALLVLNRFVAENPLESMGGSSVSSMARQSVSKLLSAQLNRLAGDLIAGVDLNFDLESTEDYSTGQKVDRTDLNVGLSKSLFNDRITVNVGSSFGLEGQETRGKASTIAGDVSVDYQLSRDGRYRLRAYRQNEYEGVIEGQIIETGLSFIISMDYDEFKELFEKQAAQDELP